MIQIKNKADCCGCNACGDICPRHAISYNTDTEGFWYPVIDTAKCIDCGLCDEACPMSSSEHAREGNRQNPECFAANNKNLELRFGSTSGGLFSVLAEKAFADGWHVAGAVYTEDWGVTYNIAHDKSELPRLRGSKYLQSWSSGMYAEIKKLLNRGEKVLACALPCQIAALKQFLKTSYDNLLTVDLICRYINSPHAYRRYLDSLESLYNGKIIDIQAKNKELGWRRLTHRVIFSNGKTYYGPVETDSFMQASMFLNCLSRPACYECRFKGFPRIGDITLGDYWGERNRTPLDDDTGTSVVMINSEKGALFFDGIKKGIHSVKVSLDSVLKSNPALTTSLKQSDVDRAEFFSRIKKEDFQLVVASMASRALPPKSLCQRIKDNILNTLRTFRRAGRLAQWRIRPIGQFIYLNFFHPAVKGSVLKGHCLYPTPHCVFEISRNASLELNGPLTFGESVFRKSRLESRLKMADGSKLIIGGSYGFGYGSDIELFANAVLESKGGPRTNMGTTIICQIKIIIGANTAIGRNVTLRDNNGGHLISVNGYRNAMPIIIGEHCWLTQDVIVMSGVKIGDGSIVSAGTIVNSSFPSHCVIGGSPAKVIRKNIHWKM